MAKKRFTVYGKEIVQNNECWAVTYSEYNADVIATALNELNEENQRLKEALLFFVDVANSQCSSNWQKDMENNCQRLFNCSYEEAKEKYDNYDGTWWELGL